MCPHCQASVSVVSIKSVQAKVTVGPPREATAFCCHSCGAVLSIQLDPITIRDETILALGGKLPT